MITTLIYTVTGTNSQNCSNSTVVQVKINSCTAINEISKAGENLNIYPNPSSGNLTISYNSALELTLVNELGQFIKTLSLNETNHYSVAITGLAKGIYFVSGIKNDLKFNQKIVVN
ncbi:MAG: T9SS type A sorting domain-containing protein [Flavobacteriia bacterium]|nr:T9SS type A sorting domain-containing protein [Flavobacteriia bacterium]